MITSSELSPISLWALNTHGNSLPSGKVSRLRTYAASDRVSFLCLQECGTPSPPFPNCLLSPLGSGLAILHWGYYPQRTVWSTPFALFVLFSSSPLPNPPHTPTWSSAQSTYRAPMRLAAPSCPSWTPGCTTHTEASSSHPLCTLVETLTAPCHRLTLKTVSPPTPLMAAPLTVSSRHSQNGAYATLFDTYTPQNAHTHTTKTTHTPSSPFTRRAVSTAGTPPPHPRGGSADRRRHL